MGVPRIITIVAAFVIGVYVGSAFFKRPPPPPIPLSEPTPAALPLAEEPSLHPIKFLSYPIGTFLKIRGTSTMHDWEMETKSVSGSVELPADFVLDESQPISGGFVDGKLAAKGHVSIPVLSFRSKDEHIPEVMEDLMGKTLNAAKHSLIQFNLRELSLKQHVVGEPFNFNAWGTLTIAGKTDSGSIPITIEKSGDLLKITGAIALRMTDYGVTPPEPNFGLGMTKCGDEVAISFTWMLKEKK